MDAEESKGSVSQILDRTKGQTRVHSEIIDVISNGAGF